MAISQVLKNTIDGSTQARWVCAYAQHTGLVKHKQQDALLVADQVIQSSADILCTQVLTTEVLLLAVADGVSGSPRSQQASRFVLQAAANLRNSIPSIGLDASFVRRLQSRLSKELGKSPTRGAATTIALAELCGNRCTSVNVGDSRTYLIKPDGTWQQVSQDHSYVNDLKAGGWLDDEVDDTEMFNQSMAYLIADPADEDDIPIHVARSPVSVGDHILICTDGLHETLGQQTLKGSWEPGLAPLEQVRVWRDLFMQAGGPDNLSVALARLDQSCIDSPK